MKTPAKPKAKLPHDLRATLEDLELELNYRQRLRVVEVEVETILLDARRRIAKLQRRADDLREELAKMPSARRGP